MRRGQPLSIPSPQRSTSENSTYEKSTPPVKTPIFKKSAPQLRSQPHQKWPIPSRRRKRDSKRSHLWDQASGQQWSKLSRRRRGRPCAPIIGDLLKPEKIEFSFSRHSCQTPLNSPPLTRLKFFTWDICISLIFLLNCHVELFRKRYHDNHIDSYFECTRQKQSFLEQVFGYLWQRWNFKGNFELSININAGLCVLTIPQEKS